MREKLNNFMSKNTLVGDYIGLAKSLYNRKKMENKLMQRWFSGDTKLVPGVMGETNYDKAYKRVRQYVRNSDMLSARNYVKKQSGLVKTQLANKY